MSHSDDNTLTPAHSRFVQSREQLVSFFQQPLIKKSVSVLVPGILASILFPIFGPAVAIPAAVITIQNGLKLLGISFSNDTIKKLIKPLEGKQIDESDLLDVLEDILPKDKQVNEEAAKALVTVAPTVKVAALTNPKLDAAWLGASLESSLQEQGEMMERIAFDVRELIQKDEVALEAGIQRLLQNWSRISVEIVSNNESKVSEVQSKARSSGGNISHKISADNKSNIEVIVLDSEIQ